MNPIIPTPVKSKEFSDTDRSLKGYVLVPESEFLNNWVQYNESD